MNRSRRCERNALVGAAVVVLLACQFSAAHAETSDRPLSDRWEDFRARMRANGVMFETVNTNDLLSTVSGGLRRRTDIDGDLDLLFRVDAQKLAGWKGASFFLYGLGLYGDNPSRNVGDAQGVSNIGGPNGWKLFEAWYQQNLFGERLSLLTGLYDVTSEFDVIRSDSELFVHSSFGTGADLGLSGVNGPSTFPATSFGFRLQGEITENLSVRAAVVDGVPGDPGDPTGTHIHLGGDDGIFAIGEVSYYRYATARRQELLQERELPSNLRRLTFRRIGRAAELNYDGKYALGAWGYTTSLPDLSVKDPAGNPVQRDGTYGIYALAEQNVYREPGTPFQGLTLNGRVGVADQRVNRFVTFLRGSLVYTGLIPGRDRDQAGFGVAASLSGSHFEDGQRNAGIPVSSNTVALEWTYAAYLNRSIILQPDFQYIINPGSNPSVANAFLAGARLEIHLNWFK